MAPTNKNVVRGCAQIAPRRAPFNTLGGLFLSLRRHSRPVTFGHLIDYDLAMIRLMLALICCLALAAPAWAGFDEGIAAYKRGDYETTLRVMLPLAEQGNAAAQNNVGSLYDSGKGVPQNSVEASQRSM